MFKLHAKERLALWKSFREDISRLPIDEAIEKTLTFWQHCPFVPYYLNHDDKFLWPDPWQLIEENCYCDLAKCLGIVYTLHLSAHGTQLDPEILVFKHKKTHQLYNLVYLQQGKYILNLIEGEIVNKEHIKNDLTLKYRYLASDLRLQEY
jgi:hypothetical protein